MRKVRIVLADDHAVVRQGFKMILNQEPDMEVVGEAGTGQEVVRLVEQVKADIAVLDIAMPGMNASKRHGFCGRIHRSAGCWCRACIGMPIMCGRRCVPRRRGIF